MIKGKKRQYRLTDIPEDIWMFIKQEQHRLEMGCKCAGSFEKTIYYLIRQTMKNKKDELI